MQKKQPFKPRVCVVCGRTFTPASTRAKTCSPRCSAEYHRSFCLEKAREQAFLRPYDIEAYLAKHPEQEPSRKPEQPPNQDSEKNPEPTTDRQRREQRDSVIATMALPPSQRYQHSRLWSDFQRLAAIAIEKRRIADHFALAEYFKPYTLTDPDAETETDQDQDQDPPPQPHKPSAPRTPPRRRGNAHIVPTLPPKRS